MNRICYTMAVKHTNNSDKQVQTIAPCGGYVLDHIAIESSDIAGSVKWHQAFLSAVVLHMDETWALMRLLDGTKIALVTPSQHPPHIGIRPDGPEPEGLISHRDGSRSAYCHDPHSNAVYEMIWYPTTQE